MTSKPALTTRDLMTRAMSEIPTYVPHGTGRFKGRMSSAQYKPEEGAKVLLVLQPIADLEDSARDVSMFNPAMISWSDQTPEPFLKDLIEFVKAHNFGANSKFQDSIPNLTGRLYTYRVSQDKRNPEYTRLSNIRPAD